MQIWPAIDLLGGAAVRLSKGDYAKSTVYFKDPSRILEFFEKAGASHLHVVDLDGARDGETVNFATIQTLCRLSSMEIEVGGGIRDEERIKRYLDLGVKRVILGTAAAEDPEFLQEMVGRYVDAIVVGVDAKDGKVAVRGWLNVRELGAEEFCHSCCEMGVSHIIYTDISRDGMMRGCNLPLYERLHQKLRCTLTASGGVSSEEDIRALREIGIEAAIVGKAIYEGKIDLSKVIAIGKGETAAVGG
ncbi:MAG: 1-(5-phosphoribosyl)-5-[Firmicutes bacterium]|nr:1-(5-phosphoribosyl)-5-[(5-phosphoribosylamino)methylideneamino]imidazole-4-carboxamide isomerase [Bacillota bacterium]